MNASTDRSDCRMIARSVPRSRTLCLGTVNWLNGWSRRTIMWLPVCRTNRKPCFVSILTASSPEITGRDGLIPPQPTCRTHLLGRANCPPLRRRCIQRWLHGCFQGHLPSFRPGRCNLAKTVLPLPRNCLPLDVEQLGAYATFHNRSSLNSRIPIFWCRRKSSERGISASNA